MTASTPSPPAFDELLSLLSREQVAFIVIGGIAAILHGSELMTSDLDVVYDAGPENITRLLSVLETINARYRDPAGRHIVPDSKKLAEYNINLLSTDLGPFDALQRIGDDLRYHDLVGRSDRFEIGDISIQVLSIEALIETKALANRPKDRMALPYLRELLDQQRARG